MKRIMTFKEFMNAPMPMNAATKKTFKTIAEAHPVAKNHPTVEKVRNSESDSFIPFEDATELSQALLMQIVALAKQMPQANDKQRGMILSEQFVLNTSATLLTTALCVQIHDALEKIVKNLKNQAYER